jgi:hypothetical protein
MRLILTTLLCTSVLGQGAEAAGQAGPQAPVEIRAECPKVWYRDLPVWVLVTISNSSTQQIEFTKLNYRDSVNPISLVATSTNGQQVAGELAPHATAIPIGQSARGRQMFLMLKPTWTLAPGDVRDCTLNLGGALDRLSGISGLCQVRLRLWGGGGSGIIGESLPLSVVIADRPEESLKSVLAKTKVTSAVLLNDLSFTLADVRLVKDPEIRGGLAFDLLSREVQRTKDLTAFPVVDYQRELPAGLLPQAQEFQFEIMLLTGDKSGAAALKETVLRQHPGMAYWFNAAEKGDGPMRSEW